VHARLVSGLELGFSNSPCVRFWNLSLTQTLRTGRFKVAATGFSALPDNASNNNKPPVLTPLAQKKSQKQPCPVLPSQFFFFFWAAAQTSKAAMAVTWKIAALLSCRQLIAKSPFQEMNDHPVQVRPQKQIVIGT
jgi:hypothetical protein